MRRATITRVQRARRRVDAAEAELHESVLAAVNAGVTWREIGDLFGMSRQAAHKRFTRGDVDAEG